MPPGSEIAAVGQAVVVADTAVRKGYLDAVVEDLDPVVGQQRPLLGVGVVLRVAGDVLGRRREDRDGLIRAGLDAFQDEVGQALGQGHARRRGCLHLGRVRRVDRVDVREFSARWRRDRHVVLATPREPPLTGSEVTFCCS